MWILPKQLHTSAFVPDTAALISDLDEQSAACAQSLLVRSKPTRSQTWSRKWKLNSWTRHLSGRMLKPSHGHSFRVALMSSLAATRASRLAQQASDSARPITATSGHGSPMASTPCSPDAASSRTSRDTSALDCEKSLAIWKASVIQQRGDYSARLKSARLTSGSVSSSWPTATVAEGGKIGCQPNYGQKGLSNHPAIVGPTLREPLNKSGRAVHQSPSTLGSQAGLWPTPNVPNGGRVPSQASLDSGKKIQIGLENAVNWQTPEARNSMGYHNQKDGTRVLKLGSQVMAQQWPTPRAEHDSGKHNGQADTLHSAMKSASPGKLNPRWVECLMGVPPGWTSCGSSAMASSQPPLNAPSALSTAV